MNNKKASTAVAIDFNQENQENEDSEIILAYKKLEEQCDLVLEKIKNRKLKK